LTTNHYGDAIVEIPERMRALVLDGVGFDRLRVREVPTPRPGPRQLLGRVDAAGICTSLIKLVEQGPDHKLMSGWDVTRFPIILGDEGAVTLVEVGKDLQGAGYEPGRRFVLQPAVDHPPVNHRDRYRDGGRGVAKVAVGYTLPGHLAEYILIPEEVLEARCLIPLPDPAIPHAHAAMSEPFSCVISAQEHHVRLTQETPLSPRRSTKGLKPGGVAVVVGAGAMGRMHVDLALSRGPRIILVTDLIEERLEKVRKLFARRAEEGGVDLRTVDPTSVDVGRLLKEVTGERGADDVIVAVGSPPAIEAAQHWTGKGGVLNLFGGLRKGEEIVGLDTGIIHYRETVVTGSSGGSPWDVARTLELMAEGAIDAAAHVTRVGDLEHAPRFLSMIAERALDGKAVVYPHRRTDRIRVVESWSGRNEDEYLEEAR
jgi:threonine dehydrogenase-like Zn-dependent dehydrogenase